MSNLEVLPQGQVIEEIADADKREFSLFLGAGASKSSGVPLASEMIQEWRRKAFKDRAPKDSDFEAWCEDQSWCGKDGEYSTLFGMLYKTERARQAHIEKKIRPAFPSWCYLYLANVVQAGFFNVIFTTNFDDLVNEALTTFLGYNPVVCAADSEVMSISITTDRAKIIKLHGDYLFKRLKNTDKELKQLNPNMERKLKEFAKQCGMVVIGYAGRDHSIMRVLEELMKDENSFPRGIYWGLRPEDETAPRVQELATMFPERFQLFRCEDFDLFMSQLHTQLHTQFGLNLPDTIVQPYEALRKNFQPLVNNVSSKQSNDPTINTHIQKLKEELGRPWAQAGADFDLLEAQVALGRRDHKQAIAYVEKYCEKQPDDANALTTWGDALAVQAEAENSDQVREQAAAKWKEAIQINPEATAPRYNLARYYTRAQKKNEAIKACEELLRLVPNDTGLRRNMAMLYGSSGRLTEALEEIDKLLAREPNAADLHATRATVLERRGLLAEALTELERAVTLSPEDANYHFALGSSLVRMSRWDEAAVEFNKAIDLEPNTLSFRLQVASLYWMRGQWNVVLPHLEAAVRIEPNSAEARGQLGEVYLSLGRPLDAQRETDAALKLSPQDSRILVNAGALYLRLNRPEVAEQYLLKAAQLNPSIPQPYFHLCFLYWKLYRDQDLRGAFQRLNQISPQIANQWGMQLQAAEAHFQGNRAAAAEALEKQALVSNQPPPPPPPGPNPQSWPQTQPGPTGEPSLSDLVRTALGKLSSW